MSANRSIYRKVWFWLLLLLLPIILVSCAALVFNIFQQPRQIKMEAITQVAQDIQSGLVIKVVVNGSTVVVTYNDGQTALANLSRDSGVTFEETMKNLGVTPEQLFKSKVYYDNPPQWGNLLELLEVFLLILLTGGVYLLVIRLRK